MVKKSIEEFEKLKKERLEDENKQKEFRKAGLAEAIVLLVVLIFDGYLVFTSKISWIIAITIAAVLIIFIYIKILKK